MATRTQDAYIALQTLSEWVILHKHAFCPRQAYTNAMLALDLLILPVLQRQLKEQLTKHDMPTFEVDEENQ